MGAHLWLKCETLEGDHVVRFTRPSPSVFAYCKVIKNWSRGRPGNEASKSVHYPKKFAWFTRPLLLVRGWGLGMRLSFRGRYIMGNKHSNVHCFFLPVTSSSFITSSPNCITRCLTISFMSATDTPQEKPVYLSSNKLVIF